MHSSSLTAVRLKFLCSGYQSALPLELFIGPNGPDLVAVSIAHDDTIGDLRERLGNEILLRIDWDLWADRGDSTNARVNAVLDLLEEPIASVFPGNPADIADPSAPPPPVEPYLESAPDGADAHVPQGVRNKLKYSQELQLGMGARCAAYGCGVTRRTHAVSVLCCVLLLAHE